MQKGINLAFFFFVCMAACKKDVNINTYYLKVSNLKFVPVSWDIFIDLMPLEVVSTGRAVTKKVIQEMK